MTTINQLLKIYLLICMRLQQSIFVVTLKASTSIVRSAVRVFTEKFRRPINRSLQVALYFLLLTLIVDSYFALFMWFCLSAQECAHRMGKILPGVGSNEIWMSTNIVPITLPIGQPCQNNFFLNCAFPLCKISFLFVLPTSVFLALKSNSYRSTKLFHTLSFLITIITICSTAWLYSFLIY